MNDTSRTLDEHTIEARLGATIASGLTSSFDSISPDVSTRLRFAREQALVRAREARAHQRVAAHAPVLVLGGAGGIAALGRQVPWWQRAASVLPLVMLMGGLLMIGHWSAREQVLAAADFDTQLLADDLPPSAYSDPGFAEYLRSATPP
jgi:hypothetical protein